MRATLNIPDDLLSEIQKILGEKSKTKAIVTAIKEFIRQKKVNDLISLQGKVNIEDVTGDIEELEIKEMGEDDKRWRSN